MIGRFSQSGIYREIASSGEFRRIAVTAVLVILSFLAGQGVHWPGSMALGNLVQRVLGGLSFIPHDPALLASHALSLAALSLTGLPIVWGAVRGLVRRRANVDELVSLAIVASVWQGEFLAAAVVSMIMVLGALVEEATSNSARKAIEALARVSPDTAVRVTGDTEEEVPIGQIMPGDLVRVRPGERIPVDAVVAEGLSAVDDSSITGESMPREAGPGAEVFAGTLNLTGVAVLRAERVGRDTTLGRVIRLVADAEAHKPQAASLIETWAKWFTPAVMSCAGLAWWLSGDVHNAITVLIVGCPCALILAAPTATVAAIGRAARAGILIKSGRSLEQAGQATAILFDKTGTLTEGKPRVGEIVAAPGHDGNQVLAWAAAVEQDSSHPLARAVTSAAEAAKLGLERAEDMVTRIGLGVRAMVGGSLVEVGSAYAGGGSAALPPELRGPLEGFREDGSSPVVVWRDNAPVGVIDVVDTVRPAVEGAVRDLRALGIPRLGILSGDHPKAVHRAGQLSGIGEVFAGLRPEDKLTILKEVRGQGGTVMFVGDGINDGPALAAADVGVAMGAAGTDVALETADIALMGDDPSRLPFLVHLSRTTLSVIKWNIVFALAFNALAVAAGGWGLITPVMGAVVHNVGSILVVANSARLALAREPESY